MEIVSSFLFINIKTQSLLIFGIKLTFGVFLLFVIYKIYEFIFLPWSAWRKYKKYPNVSVRDKLYPMLGDVAIFQKDEENNRFRLQSYINLALSDKKYDFKLVQMGPLTLFDICSPKALNEFEKCIPEKIDRFDHHRFLVGNIAPDSIVLMPSNKRWEERRKAILKTIGINFASKFIPMMINIVDDWIKDLEIGCDINISYELNKITFRIITKILFGKDIDKMDKCCYISPVDGSKHTLNFEECYFKYSKDEFESHFSPVGKILSPLANMRLIEPFKSNAKNKKSIDDALRSFLDRSEDDQSVYRQILNNFDFDKSEVFADVLMLLFAGFDTTSHGIGSTLYFLKKFPETLKKLLDSLDKDGISKINPNEDSSKLKDKFENCDYLNYTTKEGLRIDPPALAGLLYTTKHKQEICGVPFNKGALICINTIIPHHNNEEWHNPTEFIPERFDPESKYFFKPGTKESRDPKSYVPFTFGIRNCAGQTLAKLEAKVILSRIVTCVEYEIEKSLLENETARFNIFSQMTIKGKITKKLI